MAEQTAPSAPTPPLRRPAAFFWPGFLAGFLLLSSLSCGALFMATGVPRFDLADLQANNVGWTPPPAPPTPDAAAVAAVPTDQVVDGYPRGEQLRNITSTVVNIRSTPGYLGKPDGDIVAQVPSGGVVEIVGARAAADNLVWWRIRYTAPDGAQIEGWIAEATASGVQILGR